MQPISDHIHTHTDIDLHRATSKCPLITLPPELIDSILEYLSPLDLNHVSETCRALYSRATADHLWQTLVQENIPGLKITSSYPCADFRELFGAHDPRWFLPKYKIWFSGRDLVGKLLLARYDQRRGCIEAYQIVAISNHTGLQAWFADENHTFDPRVALHVDKPVIKFAAKIDPECRRAGELSRAQGRRFTREVPMIVDENPDSMFCNFVLAKPMPPKDIGPRLLKRFPYGCLWPPPAIPEDERVRAPALDDEYPHLRADEVPDSRSEASDHIFHIRQWIEMAPGAASNLILGQNLMWTRRGIEVHNLSPGDGAGGSAADNPGTTGAHLGEQIMTYSTLEPKLYNPTALKPWRGIWVGDYGGHGCEFLLIHQPDDDPPISDERLGLKRGEDESQEDWEARRLEKRVYRGRLEAIKLTGDPNVPRGEHTFIAEDLADDEFGRESEDSQFRGARVVPSIGHIARTGFQNGRSSSDGFGMT